MSAASPLYTLRPVLTAVDYEDVRRLWIAYSQLTNAAVCFQDLERELADLPGPYAASRGGLLLLASVDNTAIGCVGFTAFAQDVAELRRLYVEPEHRKRHVGTLLVKAALDGARMAGYQHIILHTLALMTGAQSLYLREDFVSIPPYSADLPSDVRCFTKPLPPDARPWQPETFQLSPQDRSTPHCQCPTKSPQ